MFLVVSESVNELHSSYRQVLYQQVAAHFCRTFTRRAAAAATSVVNREEKSDGGTRQTSEVTLWRNETSDKYNFALAF